MNTTITPSIVTNEPEPKKQKRGFALMDPLRHREIAQRGGFRAHETGMAHKFTSEEARAAAKKRHARKG